MFCSINISKTKLDEEYNILKLHENSQPFIVLITWVIPYLVEYQIDNNIDSNIYDLPFCVINNLSKQKNNEILVLYAI